MEPTISSSIPAASALTVVAAVSPWLYLAPLVLLLPLSVFFLFRNESDEVYVFPHIGLNIRPGASPLKKPETEWMNMGYWRDTTIFPDACLALSELLLSRANLKPKGRTLDVAVGSGDSLLTILTSPKAYPRQSHLVGLTSLSDHASRARLRTAQLYPRRGECVEVVCADAVYSPLAVAKGKNDRRHPLAPKANQKEDDDEKDEMAGDWDSITVLDAAYHFRTREVFLRQAFDRLSEGGTLALADIVSGQAYPTTREASWAFVPPSTSSSSTAIPSPSALSRTLLSFFLPFLSVPSANIVPIPTLASLLLTIGFEAVVIEDITPDVFPGFATFLKGRKGGAWRVMGIMAGWWSRSGVLRFVVVSARKPVGSSSSLKGEEKRGAME